MKRIANFKKGIFIFLCMIPDEKMKIISFGNNIVNLFLVLKPSLQHIVVFSFLFLSSLLRLFQSPPHVPGNIYIH